LPLNSQGGEEQGRHESSVKDYGRETLEIPSSHIAPYSTNSNRAQESFFLDFIQVVVVASSGVLSG